MAKLESETLSGFFACFGSEATERAGYVPKAFAVSWKDFFRWSVSYNQAALNSVNLSRGKYAVTDLGRLLSYIQYGTSEKANLAHHGTPVLKNQ